MPVWFVANEALLDKAGSTADVVDVKRVTVTGVVIERRRQLDVDAVAGK